MESNEGVHTNKARSLLDSDRSPRYGTSETALGSAGQMNLHHPSPYYVLPVALLGALAMSSTAATAYYAYATLLCRDPQHCEGAETTRYATFVATTVAVSNILGMMALGPLQQMSKSHSKLGLMVWLLVRSLSPTMLLLGVKTKCIYVALCGRAFDGLASDNLLHFILNSIYAETLPPEAASSFFGYSLALYMLGIATTPFLAGFLKDFSLSFVMAIGLFAITLVYLQFSVPSGAFHGTGVLSHDGGIGIHALFAPLKGFRRCLASLYCGLSLLAYNVVQSYIFTALLVHTSLEFGFSQRENGLLVAIAHSVAAVYLFSALYLTPHLLKPLYCRFNSTRAVRRALPTKNSHLALVSLTLQLVSLLAVGLATKAWQIYLSTALLALGLSTPSFIKAYVVGLFTASYKSEALAALAVMEVMGDILGPVVLGTLQSRGHLNGVVFFGASAILAIAILLFSLGATASKEVNMDASVLAPTE